MQASDIVVGCEFRRNDTRTGQKGDILDNMPAGTKVKVTHTTFARVVFEAVDSLPFECDDVGMLKREFIKYFE